LKLVKQDVALCQSLKRAAPIFFANPTILLPEEADLPILADFPLAFGRAWTDYMRIITSRVFKEPHHGQESRHRRIPRQNQEH
jgi:hypothetical protein